MEKSKGKLNTSSLEDKRPSTGAFEAQAKSWNEEMYFILPNKIIKINKMEYFGEERKVDLLEDGLSSTNMGFDVRDLLTV